MRLTVTRKSDLAIRAIRRLAERGTSVSGDELAAWIGTTRAFLPQVMAPLTRARWVRSTPGPRGGYRLGAPLTTVSVLDVLEAVEGQVDTTGCVLEPTRDCAATRPVPSVPCAVHDSWLAARSALLTELARRPVVSPASDRQLISGGSR